MKLYLVRHGETQWNKMRRVQGRSDVPLNEYGEYLARCTAEGLRDVEFDLAYTSPLIRARQTAEIILEGRDVPLIDEPRIQEISFGVREGMCFQGRDRDPESEEFSRFFTDTANYKVPKEGESIQHLLERVETFLKELYAKEELQGRTILLSTHGAALTAMLNCMKGNRAIGDFWGKGVPANCAVAEVEVNKGVPSILFEGRIFYSRENAYTCMGKKE